MTASADQLNQRITDLAGSQIVCLDAESSTLSPASASEEEAVGKRAVMLIPEACGEDLRFVWQHLPAPAAAIVMPPQPRSRVLLRLDCLDDRPFQNEQHPVWDLVIRLTHGGQSVATVTSSAGGTGALVPPDLNLPEIAPSWPPRHLNWLADWLRAFPAPDLDKTADPVALQAGLWLIHGFLDVSHELSQSIQGQGQDRHGDYWHGIMHRQEPDWSNAKYWFRRVGDHPVFPDLGAAAQRMLIESGEADSDQWVRRLTGSGNWDPFAFVDLCRTVADDRTTPLAAVARRIQWVEIILLLTHCQGPAAE